MTSETVSGFLNFKWEKFGGGLDDDNWIPSKLETFWKGPWSFELETFQVGDIF